MKCQRFRSWIFWLLMVCVPVQGFAAITGGCCTRGQMRAAMLASSEQRERAAEPAPCAEHGKEHATTVLKHAKPGKQCHCASCWLGAAAPPPQRIEPIVEFVDNGALTVVNARFANFIPPGPERPPKSSSLFS